MNNSSNWENYCPFCDNYESGIGVCSKIHENIRSYPSRFLKKCNGKFFIGEKKVKPIVSINENKKNVESISKPKGSNKTKRARIITRNWLITIFILLCFAFLFNDVDLIGLKYGEGYFGSITLGHVLWFAILILVVHRLFLVVIRFFQRTRSQVETQSQREILIIKEAQEALFQSNDPTYEGKLSNLLMQSPQDTINAIESRGWVLKGIGSNDTNLFLISVLDRIFRETEGVAKEKAIDTLVEIFTVPDDNSYEWLKLIETSTKLLVAYQIPAVKSKLEAKKKLAIGKNFQAIEYALSLMQ